MELLQVSQDALEKLMTKLEEVDLFLMKLEMDEEEFVPIGLEPRTADRKGGIGVEEEKDSEYRGIELTDRCAG